VAWLDKVRRVTRIKSSLSPRCAGRSTAIRAHFLAWTLQQATEEFSETIWTGEAFHVTLAVLDRPTASEELRAQFRGILKVFEQLPARIGRRKK
jgi:hypothetical protein